MKKIIMLSILVISIFSCSSENEINKVSLALDWYPNSNHAGIFYAKDKGYFLDGDLDVEVYTPSDPSSILQTVASGRDQFGISYQPDLLLARSEGVPVVIHKNVDQILKIPLKNKARSLNIGMAVAITVSEALKQNYLSRND